MASPADQFVAAHAAFRQWRLAHPDATLAEIEAQFDLALSPLRSAEIARSAVADAPQVIPVCPDCQRPMQRHGVCPRHLLTRDDGDLCLDLPRYRCSVCGTELSPSVSDWGWSRACSPRGWPSWRCSMAVPARSPSPPAS